jgi:hypothetical protein
MVGCDHASEHGHQRGYSREHAQEARTMGGRDARRRLDRVGAGEREAREQGEAGMSKFIPQHYPLKIRINTTVTSEGGGGMEDVDCWVIGWTTDATPIVIAIGVDMHRLPQLNEQLTTGGYQALK